MIRGLIAMRRGALVAGVVATTLVGSLAPSHAGDRGGAIAAGVIGGLAVGALGGAAAAGAFNQPGYAPPPPAYAPPPPRPVYVEREYAPPPPRCHRIMVRRWDPYEGAYIERPRRVCDDY